MSILETENERLRKELLILREQSINQGKPLGRTVTNVIVQTLVVKRHFMTYLYVNLT